MRWEQDRAASDTTVTAGVSLFSDVTLEQSAQPAGMSRWFCRSFAPGLAPVDSRGMTSIKVGLDDDYAAQLKRRAALVGIAPEELAAKAIEEYLSQNSGVDVAGRAGADADPLAWFGRYGNEGAQSDRIDGLLAKGFGR